MPKLTVVVVILTKSGEESVIAKALSDMAPVCRAEEGALSYVVTRDPKEPRRFVTLETWQSAEDFDRHAMAPHVRAYVQTCEGRLESHELFLTNDFA